MHSSLHANPYAILALDYSSLLLPLRSFSALYGAYDLNSYLIKQGKFSFVYPFVRLLYRKNFSFTTWNTYLLDQNLFFTTETPMIILLLKFQQVIIVLHTWFWSDWYLLVSRDPFNNFLYFARPWNQTRSVAWVRLSRWRGIECWGVVRGVGQETVNHGTDEPTDRDAPALGGFLCLP